MNAIKTNFKKCREFFYEHPRFKLTTEYIITFLGAVLSALTFAYSFRAFISPEEGKALISGGASGVSQIIVKICELCNIHTSKNYLQSIIYFLVNIPLFFLAFKKIGKRFAAFSIVNVTLTSLFISILPDEMMTLFDISNDILARALFAGVLTGLSTSIAVLFNHSAGGIDIISIYIAQKKHSNMGKYILVLNGIIVIIYTLLAGYRENGTMALYTIVYFFTSSTVVDTFCGRNKKTMLQIITNEIDLPKVIITNFPHSCTVADAKGGFSGQPRKIIYTVVSSFEVKKVLKVVHEVDPNAFVTVVSNTSVYGKFYIKPIK